MKKLTWKNHKPLICLLLATVILLLFAVWTRPRPLLPRSASLSLSFILVENENAERYVWARELLPAERHHFQTTGYQPFPVMVPETQSELLQYLSTCTQRRVPFKDATLYPEDTLIILDIVDDEQPGKIIQLSLGRSAYARTSLVTVFDISSSGYYTIDDVEQVTANILRILGLE